LTQNQTLHIIRIFKPGERLIFKRNPRYWKKDEKGNQFPYREKLVAEFVPPGNSTASLLKFQKGEIESYSLHGIDMAALLPDAEQKGYDIWNKQKDNITHA